MTETREELHDWANSVAEVIAERVGGLDVNGFWHVRAIIHNVRKNVLAGDYSHFKTHDVAQLDMLGGAK